MLVEFASYGAANPGMLLVLPLDFLSKVGVGFRQIECM